MTKQTPMSDLLAPKDTLQSPVDEVEVSADETLAGERAETGDQPQSTEAATGDQTDKRQPPKQKAKDKSEDTNADATKPDPSKEEQSEDETKPNYRLPKWQHERMRANDEKAAQAERARQAAERRAAELEAKLQQFNQQQGGDRQHQEQPAQADQFQQVLDERDFRIRAQFGFKLASQQYGEEYAHQATAWAQDKRQQDPMFARQIRYADDPVAFAITEFRKAQYADELNRHGWDLDAWYKARRAQEVEQPSTDDMMDQQPAPQMGASRTPPRTRMPNNFASTPSSAGRVNAGSSGLTPMGDLLKLK